MTPETILETVRQAGGALWVDGETLRYRMPKRLSPLVSAIRERKPELLDLLSERPAMPVGVRLISVGPGGGAKRKGT